MRKLQGNPTRRQLIKNGAIAAAGLSLPAIFASSPALAANPLRKDIDSLTAEELDNYQHAVKILIDRGTAMPANKEGYAWQAVLHNDFDRIRADGEPGGCEHRSERFFPWHRAHLAGFEKILREADPARTADVAIPYWNWTKAASGVRFPKAFEDTASPLFHSGRFHKPSDVPDPRLLRVIQWDTSDVRDNMVRQSDWLTIAGGAFGSENEGPGRLERGPHNTIHASIGPTMGEPSLASRDPIYWSFHAFIDLTWARWQRLHTDATHPQPSSEPKTKIFVEPFIPVIEDMSQTDTMPDGFRYNYSYDFASDATPIVVASGAVTNRRAVAMVQSESIARSAPIQVQPSGRKLLKASGVAVLKDVTYGIDVYVHPPSVNLATLSADDKKRYLADSATIWKSGGHSHRPSAVIFDLTKAIASLGAGDFTISVVSGAIASSAPSATSAEAMTQLNAVGPLWQSLVLEER
jgi:tyrosinase-like protein